MRGICKRFKKSKGYGFITCSDGSGDVFIHVDDNKSFYSLQTGNEVEFEIVKKNRKRRAVNARCLNCTTTKIKGQSIENYSRHNNKMNSRSDSSHAMEMKWKLVELEEQNNMLQNNLETAYIAGRRYARNVADLENRVSMMEEQHHNRSYNDSYYHRRSPHYHRYRSVQQNYNYPEYKHKMQICMQVQSDHDIAVQIQAQTRKTMVNEQQQMYRKLKQQANDRLLQRQETILSDQELAIRLHTLETVEAKDRDIATHMQQIETDEFIAAKMQQVEIDKCQ